MFLKHMQSIVAMASCLTSEDCHVLLDNFQNYHLNDFSLKPFNKELRGYLGEHLLLKLNVTKDNKDEELSFFVKNTRCEGLCVIFKDSPFYDKEHFVYKFFKSAKSRIPDAPTECIPRLYYTVDEVIVLENLSERSYIANSSHTFDKNHVLKALEALAKFHSISVAFEESVGKELGRRYTLDEDYQQYFDPIYNLNKDSSGYKFIQSVLFGALTLIDHIYTNKEVALDFKKRLSSFVKNYYKILNDKNSFRKVIAHGDLWGNNILFKYKKGIPVAAKLIDFQLFRYAPPAHDVTMLVYMTNKGDNLQKFCSEYYDHYYRCFGNELAKLNLDIANILPLSEYEQTCRIYMRVAKYTWLAYRQTSETNSTAALSREALESVVIGCKERMQFVLNTCENEPNYKKVMEHIVEDIRLATNCDILSTEDCFQVVNNKLGNTDYTLTDYKLNAISESGERGGYLGEHYILTVNIKRDVEETLDFFVKLIPETESQKKFAEESGATFKEMQFFKQIIPDSLSFGISSLEEVAPKCYLSEASMIIVDNLKSLGFKTASIRDGISFEDLKLGIKTIAKLHASGFVLEEKFKEKYGKEIILIDIYPKEFRETFYSNVESSVNLILAGKKAIKEQIKLFSNYTTNINPDQFLNIALPLFEQFPEFCKPSNKHRNTICHGDLWCNNIMVSKDNCVLVDFQSYRYYPPAFDLMEHIYLSTKREERRLHLDKLLDLYYAVFKSVIESYGYRADDILSSKEFLESCEDGKLFATVQSVTHKQNISIAPAVMHEIFQQPEFLNNMLFVDRSEHLKVQCNNDPIYRNLIEDATKDLRELCENIARQNKK